MSTKLTIDRFKCPGCGRTFAWEEKYASKRVRCGCGTSFQPTRPVSRVDLPASDPYDIDDTPAPAPTAPKLPPTPLRPAPIVSPARARAIEAATDYDIDAEESKFKGVILPILLICIGLAVRLGRALLFPADPDQSAAANVVLVFCETILATMTMLIGCAIAAQLLSVNFGSLDRAILKLTAAAVCASAVGSVLMAAMSARASDTNAMVVAWHAVVILYWFFFATFFDLDMQETLLSVSLTALLQVLVSFALAKGLNAGGPMSLLFSR